MALPTTLYGGVIIATNGITGPKYFRAGDSLMKPATVCTHDAANDEIKQCGTTDRPYGIIGCDSDHDLSTVYTVGDRVPVWLIGSGVEVWILCGDADSVDIVKGSVMHTADSSTYPGKITLYTYHQATTFTDINARYPINEFFVGLSQEMDTVTATIAKYLPVII